MSRQRATRQEELSFDTTDAACATFVRTLCEIHNRDDSHGFQHAKQVCDRSMDIAYEMGISDENIMKLICVTAWLHDVADGKYDDGKIRKITMKFIENSLFMDPVYVYRMIDRISYSKEVEAIRKNTTTQWFGVLDEQATLIRNVVSDADKLEALGADGVTRVVIYNQHVHGDEPDDIIREHIRHIVFDRLVKYKDGFMRTAPGQRMSYPMTDELVAAYHSRFSDPEDNPEQVCQEISNPEA